MIVSAPALTALRTGFRKDFQNGLAASEPQYTMVATVVPSSSKSNTYGWLGKWPGFREWIGDRVIESMKEHGYTITNKSFESTIGVDRDDVEDDNLGIYSPMFKEMGEASNAFPDEKVFPLLTNGFTNTCYDGQFFFDTDHPVAAKADGTGAVTNVSNVSIDGGYAGEPWYLLDTTRSLKPLIYQERKKPNFVAMDNPNDPAVFTKKEFQYGVDLRANAGYGFWQMAHGAKIALTFDNLWAAYEAMTSIKADGGRPLKIRPKLLVVSKTNERAARELIDKQRLANGEDNILYKKFEILVADSL